MEFQAAEESLSRNHPADQSFFVDSQSPSLISRLPAPQEDAWKFKFQPWLIYWKDRIRLTSRILLCISS